jgi:hypothetical protein
MTSLELKYKIKKWENSFIRDRWGNLIKCYWNSMCKEEIIKLEVLLKQF